MNRNNFAMFNTVATFSHKSPNINYTLRTEQNTSTKRKSSEIIISLQKTINASSFLYACGHPKFALDKRSGEMCTNCYFLRPMSVETNSRFVTIPVMTTQPDSTTRHKVFFLLKFFSNPPLQSPFKPRRPLN